MADENTPDLSPETLARLLEKITKWPWRLGSWGDNVFGTGAEDEWLTICRVKRDNLGESLDHVDASLIALAPSLAAQRISDAKTIERLTDCLQSIIDWSDLAQSRPDEFSSAEARMLRGPIFDDARTALKGEAQ